MVNKDLQKEADKLLRANGFFKNGAKKNRKVRRDTVISRLEKKWNNAYDSQEYLYLKAQNLLTGSFYRAKQIKVAHDLDFYWFLDKLRRQGAKCEITGISFTSTKGPKNDMPWQATVDRIDSTKGYTKNNSQLTCWLYNRAKGCGRHRDVLYLAECLVLRPKEKAEEDLSKANYI